MPNFDAHEISDLGATGLRSAVSDGDLYMFWKMYVEALRWVFCDGLVVVCSSLFSLFATGGEGHEISEDDRERQ